MVNKVDGNNYNIYTKQKKIEIPDTGEKFDLNYKRDKLSSEERDKKDKELSEKERQQAEQSGVRLELSSNGQFAGASRQGQESAAKERSTSGQKPLLQTIQEFVAKAIAAVQDFFRKIWNDQTPEGTEVEELPGPSEVIDIVEPMGLSEDADVPEAADIQETIDIVDDADILEDGADALPMDEERRNRKIQQSLREGDMEQVISLLTDNGRRTIAKNSTLLTSYDRNGRVVEPNASDRQRALYGDKNSWKL